MDLKDTDTKQNTPDTGQNKFTDKKRRIYSDITDQITSQLQTALILYKLKTGNNGNPDVAELSYDQDWIIRESKAKDAEKKGPVDIQGDNEKVNIFNIKKKLYQIIDQSEIVEQNDKKHLKDGIDDFIRRQFLSPRINLKSKIHLPYKQFHIFYSKVAAKQEDLDTKGQRLYKDICLTLANLLFEKDNEHLKEWKKKKDSLVLKVKEGEVEIPQENIKPEDLVKLPNGATARFEDGKEVDKQKKGEQEVVIIVEVGNNGKEKKIPVRIAIENGKLKVKEKCLVPTVNEREIEIPQENIKPEDLVKLPNGATARFEDGKEVDKQKNGEQKVVIIVKAGNNGKEKKIPVRIAIENGKLSVKEWPPTHYNFVNEQGQITEKGLQYIGQVFLTTIRNIPDSRDPKEFHEIFHDGDFNFLSEKDSAGNPRIIGTLNQYVRAIMYLMTDLTDGSSANAYPEGEKPENRERRIAKKGFLNKLYNASQLKIDINKHQETSDQGIIHNKLCEAWIDDDNDIPGHKDWRLTSRLKTESSKLLKIGGRTSDINDESGVRATYYGDMQDKEGIKTYISHKIKKYFSRVLKNDGIYIKNITLVRKGDFISKDSEDIIRKELIDITGLPEEKILLRKEHGKKKSKLERIISKYKTLQKQNQEISLELQENQNQEISPELQENQNQEISPELQENQNQEISPGLQKAYKIASGEIVRGANGDYTDFKLCVEYSYKAKKFNKGLKRTENRIQQDGTLHQEISFYTIDNDLNMGNHGILDLEKNIFDQVQNVDAFDVGKTISLEKLRCFTETAIKNISQETEKRTEQIQMGLQPQPKNDDYKYLCINGKKLPWEGLVYRNKNNTNRLDTLIVEILNYFLTRNKIFYIIPPNKWLKYSYEDLEDLEDKSVLDGDLNTANEIEEELRRRQSLRNKGQADQDDTGVSEQQLGLITKKQLHDNKEYRGRRFTTSRQLRKSATNPNNANHHIGLWTSDDTRPYNNFYVVNLGKLKKIIGLE